MHDRNAPVSARSRPCRVLLSFNDQYPHLLHLRTCIHMYVCTYIRMFCIDNSPAYLHLLPCFLHYNKVSASSDEEERPVERRRRRKVSSPREKADAEIHPDVEPPVIEGPSAWRPPQAEVNSSSQSSAGLQQPRRFRLPTEGE